MKLLSIIFGFLCFSVLSVSASDYSLNITSDSPVAIGTSVTFNITLLLDGEVAPNNRYQFRYEFLGRGQSRESNSPSQIFSIDLTELNHGSFKVRFFVEEWFIFMYAEKAKADVYFNITNRFNGLMQLVQNPNSTVRENGFVSSQSETVHHIVVADKDRKLLDKASYFRVFWFVDCLYLGVTDTLNFTNWYRQENAQFNVEALLEISNEPLPTPTTSTTTTTTTTTPSTTSSTTTTSTTPSTTTSSSTTTTTTPSTTTSTSTTTTKKPSSRRRRAASLPEWNVQHLVETGSIRPESIIREDMQDFLGSLTTTTPIPMDDRIRMLDSDLVPYFGMCTSNSTKVLSDPKKIYGYYQRTIKVENPIVNITVGNNIWLKHGDLCNLTMKYYGTSPFKYCIKQDHNSTRANSVASIADDAKECEDFEWRETNENEVNFHRFLPKSSNSYTIIFYIKNEVSLTKTPIGIQFYEDKPHSQLSVIIIPVVFSLVAVVMIVFGVAYYIQNRNQFLIETADFDFGETASVESLEYKSFLQRLLDSVSDLFIRQDYLEESSDNNLPGPAGGSIPSQDSNIRYGAMS